MSSTSPKYTLYHASSMSSTYIIALLELFSVPYALKTIEFACDFDPECSSSASSDAANQSNKSDSGGAGRIVFKTQNAEELYAELKSANPLAQFPTLVVELEDGKERGKGFVLSEMAAIAFYIHDNYAARAPQWSTISLTPAQLGLYYRIMVFIPANMYPCITLYDFPERFVKVPPSHSQAQVPAEIVYGWAREQGRENLKKMFGVLEGLMFCSDSGGAGGETPYAVGSASPTLADVYITNIAHYAPRPRPTWLRENCPRVYACARETLKHPVLRKVFLEQDFECHLAE